MIYWATRRAGGGVGCDLVCERHILADLLNYCCLMMHLVRYDILYIKTWQESRPAPPGVWRLIGWGGMIARATTRKSGRELASKGVGLVIQDRRIRRTQQLLAR